MSDQNKTSRTDFIKSIAAVPAVAAAIVAGSSAADAAAKSSKSALKYQDKPNGAMKCSGCSLYIPNKVASKPGACKVVAGVISPNGYCIAYAKK